MGNVEVAYSTFGYFDGTAWTLRLQSPTPIMAPVFFSIPGTQTHFHLVLKSFKS